MVNAEGMLESYFTSLRFSEDFLKEGKVYVKNIEKTIVEKSEPNSPIVDELTETIEKIEPNNDHIITTADHQQIVPHQHPVVVSNINASNIQIISGVQARVQQYKCAMQVSVVIFTVYFYQNN